MPLTPIGAEAVVGGYAEFMQRIENMSKKLNSMGEEYAALGKQADKTDRLGDSIKTMSDKGSGGLQMMGQEASRTMGFMDKLGFGFIAGIGGAIGMKAMSVLGGLQSSLMGVGRQAVESASRVGEMTLTSRLLGATVGLSVKQVDSQIASLRKLNMTSQAANELVQQFSRYQIDMGMATKLASAAQDLAVLSGKDSSETVQDLIYGITTLNPMVLRTAGINVSTAQAYDKMAASLNTSVESLTDEQRVMAFLNATLEDAVPLQGAYALAMESGSKVMRSLSGRVIPELITIVGMPFQEAYTNVAKVFYDLASALSIALDKGGALYPVIQTLGAVFAVATEGPRQFAEGVLKTFKTASDAGAGVVAGISNPILQAIEKAATWGFGIITSLADGIITGTSFILTAAMQFVGQVLASWLSSSSPPKVAPDLPKWGMGAMNEWLKGFTEGDFNILEGIQGQLKSVLDVKDMGDQFLGYSAMITSAIADWSKTGAVSADVFTKLEAIGGELGAGIAELARRRFALAAATKAQVDAEKALKAAQDSQVASQGKIDLLVRQYNELRRGGASKAILRQKALELDAATKERDAAGDAIKVAEKQKETAEGNVKVYGDQVQLQEKLLSQLIDGQRILTATIGGIRGGTEDLAAAISKPLEKPDLTKILSMDEDFEKLKKDVTKHWEDMTKPLKEKWDEKLSPTLKTLGDSFNDFFEIVKKVNEALFGKPATKVTPLMEQAMLHPGVPKLGEEAAKGLFEEKGFVKVAASLAAAFAKGFLQELYDVLFGKPAKITTMMEQAMLHPGVPELGAEAAKGLIPEEGMVKAAVSLAGAFVSAFIDEVTKGWGKESLWSEAYKKINAGLTTALEGMVGNVVDALFGSGASKKTVGDAAKNFSDWFAQSLVEPEGGWGKVTPAGQAAIDAFGAGLRMGAVKLADLADEYDKWADDVLKSLSKKWDEIKADASKKWDEFKDEIIRIAKKLWTDLVGGSAISDIEDDVRKTWERMLAKATEIWNNIKSAIVTPITSARDEASRILGELETNFKTAIGNIQTFLADPKAGFLLALSNLQEGFQKVGDYVKDTLSGKLKDFLEKIITPLKLGWEGVEMAVGKVLTKLGDLWNWIVANLDRLREFLHTFSKESPPALQSGFEGIADAAEGLQVGLKPLLGMLLKFTPLTSLLKWAQSADKGLAVLFKSSQALAKSGKALLDWLDDVGQAMRNLAERWSPAMSSAFGSLSSQVDVLRQAVLDLGGEMRGLPSLDELYETVKGLGAELRGLPSMEALTATMRDLAQVWAPAVHSAFDVLEAQVEALREAIRSLAEEIRNLPPLPPPPGGGASSAGLAGMGPVAMPLLMPSAGGTTNQYWSFNVTTAGGLAAITQSYAIARAVAGA